ncbi:hypothetical protein [Brucella rhizosphaerae]|uniref:hypothetical protein n=1 Tax=Brucella rhizosphaerae TaxID=571254 RepID=UPI000B97D12C|nr:hypothetical protein [Brucella rhizosphaerae]
MDDTQRVTVAFCLIGMVALGLGSFLYVEKMEREASRAKANREIEFAICSQVMKNVRGSSLVLTNKSVKTGLECAEKLPEFRAFKDLYDERSPDSPIRKPYNPQYWPDFP